jgi:hypothetical protein
MGQEVEYIQWSRSLRMILDRAIGEKLWASKLSWLHYQMWTSLVHGSECFHNTKPPTC